MAAASAVWRRKTLFAVRTEEGRRELFSRATPFGSLGRTFLALSLILSCLAVSGQAGKNIILWPGLAFSSVADGSQMIYDRKFCDSVADLLVNLGQFW